MRRVFQRHIGNTNRITISSIQDDYFVIATFALQVILFNVLNNWTTLTGGASGLPGIPKLTLLGLVITSHANYLLLVGLFCIVTLWVTHKLVTSPFGRVLMAIREDEVFTQAVGKNVASFKVLVFIFGSCMASVAGVIYAYYVSFIDPTSFTVMESIFIVTIVIIGGAGSFWGPVVGATFLVILPELLRFVGLPGSIAANVRQILYGGLLVAFMMWRPQGLLGVRKIWRR